MLSQVSNPEPHKQLERIFYALPLSIDEPLWARPLGENQYEVRSIPILTPNLNFKDIVYVRASSVDQRLYIRQVIRWGGHKTLRIDFENASEAQRREILNQLSFMQTRYESLTELEESYALDYALDVAPQCDYTSILNYLRTLEVQGSLNLIIMGT